jgi:hypothetical protein
VLLRRAESESRGLDGAFLGMWYMSEYHSGIGFTPYFIVSSGCSGFGLAYTFFFLPTFEL